MGGMRQINSRTVQHPDDLVQILDAFNTEIAAIRVLINEIADDRTAGKTALDEVVVDIAAAKTDLDAVKTYLDSAKAVINNQRGYHNKSVVLGAVNLRTDAVDTDKFTTGDFGVIINGHHCGAIGPVDGVGQALSAAHAVGNDGGDHYGMILFLANEDGTVSTAVNTTPQLQVSKFAAAMMAVTIPSDAIPCGAAHFEIANNDTWTGNTDSFDAVGAEVDAYQLEDYRGHMGVLIASDGIVTDATPEQFDVGAGTVLHPDGVVNAYDLTAGYAFSMADTINTGTAAGTLWGGWLVMVDPSDNVYTLSADGSPAASDQTYADQATAQAALDALRIKITAQAPFYAIVGQILVQAKEGTAWTANTDDLTTTDANANATYTMYPAAYSTSNVHGALYPVAEASTLTVTTTAIAATITADPAAANVIQQVKSGT